MDQYKYILFRDGVVVFVGNHMPQPEEKKLGDILYYRDFKIGDDPFKWYIYKQSQPLRSSFLNYSDVPEELKLAVILLGEEP